MVEYSRSKKHYEKNNLVTSSKMNLRKYFNIAETQSKNWKESQAKIIESLICQSKKWNLLSVSLRITRLLQVNYVAKIT